MALVSSESLCHDPAFLPPRPQEVHLIRCRLITPDSPTEREAYLAKVNHANDQKMTLSNYHDYSKGPLDKLYKDFGPGGVLENDDNGVPSEAVDFLEQFVKMQQTPAKDDSESSVASFDKDTIVHRDEL